MLRDLFIDFYPIDGLWLRVGNQIIARGESNLLISSDIANPRDLSTIGLQDLDDIRLHIPSILAAYNIGSVKQEIIVFLDEKRNKVARPERHLILQLLFRCVHNYQCFSCAAQYKLRLEK